MLPACSGPHRPSPTKLALLLPSPPAGSPRHTVTGALATWGRSRLCSALGPAVTFRFIWRNEVLTAGTHLHSCAHAQGQAYGLAQARACTQTKKHACRYTHKPQTRDAHASVHTEAKSYACARACHTHVCTCGVTCTWMHECEHIVCEHTSKYVYMHTREHKYVHARACPHTYNRHTQTRDAHKYVWV